MLIHFQLLQGMHMEGSDVFKVETERDKETGKVLSVKQPIVVSERDLAVEFGIEKFRRVSEGEMNILMAGQQNPIDSAPAAPQESEVAKAVKEGAVAIAEPPGVDTTGKFPEIIDDWHNITVYFKRGKGYFVTDGDALVTKEPLKRKDVVKWVQSYMEG